MMVEFIHIFFSSFSFATIHVVCHTRCLEMKDENENEKPRFMRHRIIFFMSNQN